jgi:hypothetical protein
MSSPASLLSGSPASLWLPARQGQATIPLGAKIIAVADPLITANSLVVCSASGAVDATAFVFSCSRCEAGVGFSLQSNDDATAAVLLNWAVLKY